MATVTADALTATWGTTFQEVFNRANVFRNVLTTRPPINSNNTFYQPVDRTPLSVQSVSSNLNNVASWTIPTSTRDVASVDEVELSWDRVWQCGLDIAPPLVEDTPADLLIRMAARRATAVANSIENRIVSVLHGSNQSSVALDMSKKTTTTSMEVSLGAKQNWLNPTNGQMTGSSKNANEVYDAIRQAKVVLETNNMRGPAANVNHPFIIVAAPQVRYNLEIAAEGKVAEVFTPMVINGLEFSSFMGMPFITSSALVPFQRTVASKKANYFPIYVMNRNAVLHAERFDDLHAFTPSQNVIGKFYRIDNWLETATAVTAESKRWMYRIWVRAQSADTA